MKEKIVNPFANAATRRIAAKKRVVSFILLAMLWMATGALVANSILDPRGSLSLLWLMAMALFACYWLRLVLADWMKRIDMQADGDESAANGRIDGA